MSTSRKLRRKQLSVTGPNPLQQALDAVTKIQTLQTSLPQMSQLVEETRKAIEGITQQIEASQEANLILLSKLTGRPLEDVQALWASICEELREG